MAEIPELLKRPVETPSISFTQDESPTVELYDHANQTIVNMPEQDVEHALMTGNYSIKKGSVDVIAPSGEAGIVDSSKIRDAIAEGYQLEKYQQKAERELQEKYGSNELLAGAAGAARTASFGASDVALTQTGLVAPETLAGLSEANPIATGVGEVTGFFTPGGAGSATIKTGLAAEKFIAKQLIKSGVKEGVAKNIIAKIAPKMVGGAVEGSLMGVGQLVSEDALGKADFNAENLMAYTGMGAATGGAIGSLFGSVELAAPIIKKASSAIVDPLASSLEKTANKSKNALELLGYTPSRISKLKERNPKLFDELPDFLKNDVGLKTLDSSQELFNKVQNLKEVSGQKIGDIYDDVVKIYEANGMKGITKKEVYQDIAQNIDDKFIKRLEGVPEYQTQLKPIKELYENYIKMADNTTMTAKDIQIQRKLLDEVMNFDKVPGQWTLKDEVNNETRNILRDHIYKMADQASNIDSRAANLATELKKANKQYSYATEIGENLSKKLDKEQLLTFSDLMLGGVAGAGGILGQAVAASKKILDSDIKRKLVILSDIQTAQQKVSKTIDSAVRSFFGKTEKVVKPVSTYGLLKYNLSANMDDSTRKPKKASTRAEAYNNTLKNLDKYAHNTEALLDRSNRKTSAMYDAAPETSAMLDVTALNGIQFLASKIPLRSGNQGVLDIMKKKHLPSNLDMAKFERYVEAVENPMSVVKDFEQGYLTNEGVEVLKTVYPSIFNMIQDKVTDYLIKEGSSISFNKRLQLGMMLDIPTDSSLIPENTLALQSTFANQMGEQPNQAAVKPTTGGMKELDSASRYDTVTQTDNIKSEV